MRLQCPVTAQPTALVSWYKDDHEINIAWDNRYRVIVVLGDTAGRGEHSLLKVRNTTTTDSGVYVCTATNGFGTVRASFTVIVYRTSAISSVQFSYRIMFYAVL